MNIAKSIMMELKYESSNTNKMLERLDDGRFSYKPHDKSSSLGKLAAHIADLPFWITMVVQQNGFNLDHKPFTHAPVTTVADLVRLHNDNVAAAMTVLEDVSNEAMLEEWALRKGDHIIASMPRVSAIRNLALNHMIHHRGQLSVYMRINDIPLPGIYGPSADEQ